jgi:hypothetical protein
MAFMRMISVDDHIDLPYLPADLWTSRLPGGLTEQGPHVVEVPMAARNGAVAARTGAAGPAVDRRR